MKLDPRLQRLAAAVKAARELIADGDIDGLKVDVERFVDTITTKAGPKPSGEHYTADDLHALADETRANFDEAIARSADSE